MLSEYLVYNFRVIIKVLHVYNELISLITIINYIFTCFCVCHK